MKSLLHQPGATTFTEPSACTAVPCRVEVPITVERDGRLYTFMLRDKVVPEDAYLPMVKAIAFAIQNNEPYAGTPVGRDIKDYLIKDNVVV